MVMGIEYLNLSVSNGIHSFKMASLQKSPRLSFEGNHQCFRIIPRKRFKTKSWRKFFKYPWIGRIFQHYAIVFYKTSRILHFYTKHVQISWRKGERNSWSLSFLPNFFCFGVPPIGGQFLLSRNKPVHVVRHFFLHLHGLDVDDEVASVSRRPQVVSLLGVWHEPENDLWKCAERFLDSAPPLFTYDLHDIFTTHKTSAQRHQDFLD